MMPPTLPCNAKVLQLDAFLYLANWGTHQLMLRLPRRVLDFNQPEHVC